MTVIPNNYAPKCAEMRDVPNSHGVFYGNCNFKCKFCGMSNFGDNGADVTQQMIAPIAFGQNFKFSGGECTLNPRLPEYLRLAKSFGGQIFLDTNGSIPKAVKAALDERLIDVLGISLKGMTAEEAEEITGVDRRFCWENTWQSIRLGLDYGVRTIVTTVMREEFDTDERLEQFYHLLSFSGSVYCKINNLFENRKTGECGFRACDETMLEECISAWVERHPDIRGRVVYIPNAAGVSSYEAIRFL